MSIQYTALSRYFSQSEQFVLVYWGGLYGNPIFIIARHSWVSLGINSGLFSIRIRWGFSWRQTK
ncbi:MAG: hypothetical protein ACK4LB_12285 [Spirosomataceae bacterium]